MAEDTYEVYAVHYGHHDRQSSANYIGGDVHDALQPLDYYVWAIVGHGGTFVLDTGFDAEMGKKRSRGLVRPIGEGLKAIGINPDTIENVIVSHLHFDHAGNYGLFPRARYHLQDIEMAYATGRCMCHDFLKMPFEEEDIVAMVRKVFAGRVAFHDGTDEVAPGITVHRVGGHSKGLQCVRVKTRRGYVVLASDATHLYNHFEQGRVFPTTYNPAEVLEGYDLLRKLASSSAHIIPGHDPAVLKRYRAAKSGLEGWVVRLDADPH
ncbi:MAG TPA: N-acyl homoserine lactonase family protein [Pseudolabrys sp.]|jgi:glyoxylase-like metal-dependent hydrolase (beta-lactamase superfamily II)